MEGKDSFETDHDSASKDDQIRIVENPIDKAMGDECIPNSNLKNFIPVEEYEAQYFGFAPSDLCEAVKDIVYEKFELAINELEKKMKKIPNDVMTEKELTDGISSLRTMCNENNEAILSRLKEYMLQNIFKIPSNLLLPEDDVHVTPSTSEEVDSLKKEIEEIKLQLKSERYLEAVLTDELKDIDIVLQAHNDLLETMFSDSNVVQLEAEKRKLKVLSENVKPLLKNYETMRQSFKSGLSEAKEDIRDAINEMCLQ
ncbi:UNVERIFIED_CONTAM: hypothetical protein RMT77_010616 [Armadillidium vulgare]